MRTWTQDATRADRGAAPTGARGRCGGRSEWHSLGSRAPQAVSRNFDRSAPCVAQPSAPASACGRPASTGSPCETRTRSTGSSSNGRSIARRSSCVPSPSQRSGQRRRARRSRRLGTRAEQDVADDERALLGQPVGDLGRARRLQRANAARQLVAGAERIGHRDLAGCAAAAPSASAPRPGPPRASPWRARASRPSRSTCAGARARPAARADRSARARRRCRPRASRRPRSTPRATPSSGAGRERSRSRLPCPAGYGEGRNAGVFGGSARPRLCARGLGAARRRGKWHSRRMPSGTRGVCHLAETTGRFARASERRARQVALAACATWPLGRVAPATHFLGFRRSASRLRACRIRERPLGSRAPPRRRGRCALRCRSARSALVAAGCGASLGGRYDRPTTAPGAVAGAGRPRARCASSRRSRCRASIPAFANTRQSRAVANALCTPLVRYADAEGLPGTVIVPGLARDLPVIARGSRTFRVQLLAGLRFSDGGARSRPRT